MMNIAILDVPVLLDATNPHSSATILSHWCKLYDRGSRLYPSISVTVCSLYLYAMLRSNNISSRSSRGFYFLVAAVTTLTMIPYTLLVMMPTNNMLFQARNFTFSGAETPWEEVRELVIHWQQLHFLRSLFPLAGSVIGMLGAF
ncbi:hypothetical protein F5Y19DRAFT_460081 [Xylariaceae sp. FL1651]|nr:hypothetical protein F5Y19DRAFT_460081 [Xylariaceae sp. FL1651]